MHNDIGKQSLEREPSSMNTPSIIHKTTEDSTIRNPIEEVA